MKPTAIIYKASRYIIKRFLAWVYQHERREFESLMALDVGLSVSGKAIIMTRIKDRDYVKIIDIRPRMTFVEYHELCTYLAERYKAVVTHVDGFPDSDNQFKNFILRGY